MASGEGEDKTMNNKIMTERTHYYAPAINIVLIVNIGGNPTEEELRTAIHKTVEKHEILSSKVTLEDNGDGYYIVIPKGILKIETRNSEGEEDWKQIIYEQERIPFNFIEGELLRFFILRKIDVTQLVIVAHHLVGDGLAMTYLIRDIMTALADPSVKDSKQPIRLFQEEDMPKTSALNPLLQSMVKRLNKSWNKQKRVFQYEEFLTMFQKYWSNCQTSIEDIIISGEDLRKLQEKCKSNHITINSAITTAFLLAAEGEKEVGMAVSVRPEGYEGMGNYASGVSFSYLPKPDKSFWKNAKIVHSQILKKLHNVRKKYFVLQFMNSMEPTLIDAIYFNCFDGYENGIVAKFRDMFRYNRPRGMGITNLTKLKMPSSYGQYYIENLKFVAPIVPNAKRIIGVVTLEDQMAITMNYQVKEASENMKQLFRDAMNILIRLDNAL